MKLWILEPNKSRPEIGNDNDPWEPWWDKCFGMVVRASSEEDARRIADENGFCENGDIYDASAKRFHPWLDPNLSACVELLPGGEPGVILSDNREA